MADNKMDLSNIERGIFLVNSLGIIFNPETKKVLIGRRENDPHLKELTWCFPGGRPCYDEEIKDSLKEEIKKKTGINVKIEKIVFAKTYPERKNFMSIYYLCEPLEGTEKAGEKFVELKWIDPTEIENYFTTSFHPELKEIILNLK